MTLSRQLFTRPIVLASLFGVVALAAGWWFAWMSPQSAKLASVREQQVQAEASRSALLFRLEELQQDAKQATAATAYLSRFDRAIPAYPDAPGLVVQVYDLATRDNVKLLNITDNSLIADGGYSTIPVSIDVSGGHDDVLAFVKGLYSIPRLLTIQTLSLSGAGNVNQSSSVSTTATISATAYTLQVEKTPARNG